MQSEKPLVLSSSSLWTLLFALLIFISGCVAIVSTIAIVKHMKSSHHETTTVLINKPPEEVYAAMNKIVQQTPDIVVKKKNEADFLIEASRGENNVTAQAAPFESGRTQLIVTADAGEDQRLNDELSLRVVTKICEELKVDYIIK